MDQNFSHRLPDTLFPLPLHIYTTITNTQGRKSKLSPIHKLFDGKERTTIKLKKIDPILLKFATFRLENQSKKFRNSTNKWEPWSRECQHGTFQEFLDSPALLLQIFPVVTRSKDPRWYRNRLREAKNTCQKNKHLSWNSWIFSRNKIVTGHFTFWNSWHWHFDSIWPYTR